MFVVLILFLLILLELTLISSKNETQTIPLLSQTRFFVENSHKNDGKMRILLVFPGLGRSDRLETVLHNLQILFDQEKESLKTNSPFQFICVVYIYASRLETEFWSNEAQLQQLSKFCQLIENPGKKVTENMFLIQPIYLKFSFDYVFLILDDVKIKNHETFQITKMLQIMKCNDLSILSPLVRIFLSISILIF